MRQDNKRRPPSSGGDRRTNSATGWQNNASRTGSANVGGKRDGGRRRDDGFGNPAGGSGRTSGRPERFGPTGEARRPSGRPERFGPVGETRRPSARPQRGGPAADARKPFPRPEYVKPFSDEDVREVALTDAIPNEERLEGRNAVLEALAAGRAFNKVWYLKPLPDKKMDHRLIEIVHRFIDTDTVLYPVERKILDRMAVTPSHQGIIAQVAAHQYAEPEDILALAEARGEKPFILLLDQIQDSQNLGAIMRTADAAGVHGIIMPRRRSVALDASAAKSSAGAIEHVLCARVTNLNRTIEDFKARGIWVAGLAMEGEPIFTCDKLDIPLALVIGSEGQGISQSVAEHCDFLLQIPMRGKINSLNASNAAAVAMYEVFRHRTLPES